MTPLSRADALRRVMGECLVLSERLDEDNVRRIVGWIAGIDCYALNFSSLDRAVELVGQVAPPSEKS